MTKTIQCPIRAIAAALRAAAKSIPAGSDELDCDVRLQVHMDGTWTLHAWSSEYDTDHRGVWGASSVPLRGRFDSMALARKLWNECVDMAVDGFNGPNLAYAHPPRGNRHPFRLLTGDASGIPSTYYRPTPGVSGSFDVYEVNMWEDLDSSAVATHGKYNVQAGTVCVEHADANAAAARSCGYRIEGSEIVSDQGDVLATAGTRAWDAVLVDCFWGYGAKEVTADVSGNNLRKCIAQARGSL